MPFRPTHRQRQYFVAVVTKGHFQEAARLCNVSQPTLSTQLRLLEDQLGVTLVAISDLPMERTIGFAWRKNSMRSDHYRTLCKEATRSIVQMDRAELAAIG